MEKTYKKFKVSKKNGKYRTIYAPTLEYKRELKSMVKNLALKMEKVDKEAVSFAFQGGRNAVLNAEQHIGHKYSLCLDLTDFFDCVSKDKCKKFLNKEELELCFINNVAKQGMSTSPAIANLCFFYACDKAILKMLKKHKYNVVYTRYADDLTFSFDDIIIKDVLYSYIKNIVNRAGFQLNDKKTKLLDSKQGRRIITGVAVDDEKIYVTRKIKRKIRAARHQKNQNSLQGLQEWSKLKKPKVDKKEEKKIQGLYETAKKWGLAFNLKDVKNIPYKETIKLGNNCIIDGSSSQMLGMSTFTTGWTSCMSRKGQYKKGIPFWIMLKGTRIAYQTNNKDIEIDGIKGKQMISRCLVHQLRNGVLVYDKFYGNNTDVLKKELKEKGVISVYKAREKYKDEKIKGNVPQKYKPYFDNLKMGIGKRKGSQIKIRYAYL